MKKALLIVFCLFLLTLLPGITSAQDLSPSYREAVDLSIDHASNPTGWRPASLFVISPTAPASQGLTYDNGNPNTGALIVRTATVSSNYSSNYVGQANYKIWKTGDPTHYASWVSTGNDATKFLLANSVTGSNVTKLIERGLGMNTTGTHDAIVEFTVKPGTGQTLNDLLMRPTRNPDITQYLPTQYYNTSAPVQTDAVMNATAFANFVAYYNNFKADAYNTSDATKMFPFSQLGYTFFWGNGYSLANITGMSEFIMLGGTPVGIYGIYATQSYIYTRNDGTNFNSASDAQYGNGFASFKINGACDTVWAGHRFQNNVRTTTATPNQITIDSGGSISGGQGLLVWSLNYDVENNGTISGATTKKFGISGTDNIALLFKGDTSNSYGTPVTTAGAVNRLTNNGTISSPGTAIKAEAGDTVITNNPGGIISGGNYAIQTGGGNDTVTVKGGEINGTVDLGTGTDKVDVVAGSNAKFNFTLNKDTTTSAQTIKAQTVNIADNTKLAVTTTGSRNIRNNDKYQIVSANALTVNPANLTIQNDSPLPMVTLAAGQEGNNLYIVASRNNSYYQGNSGNASLGALLDSLANTATGDFANVLSDLDTSGAAANARKMEPTVDRGALQAGFATNTQVTRTIINRMVELRTAGLGPGESGISTGDELAKWGVWTQGFGAFMNQAAAGSSNGYTANIWGGSLGFDRLVYNNVLVGLSGSYARNNIRTADVSTNTNADSYQGNLYGNLARDAYYVNGILSYAYNRYDASRHIVFGTTNRIATSNYGGQQYSAYVEGGYGFKNGGFDITPLLSLQYMRLHINDYAEAGADSLNLNVDAQRYNMFQSGLGAKVAYPMAGRDLRFIPEVHAKWFYDFVGDPQQATSTFTGGGASFATQGIDPAKSSYNLGAMLTIMTTRNVTLTLNYDFDMKTDFYSHNGYFNLRYVF